jgi:hypothetical protein
VVISYCAGTRTLNKERILKATKEKRQVTYKGKPIRIKADFTTQTVNARMSWKDIIQAMTKKPKKLST